MGQLDRFDVVVVGARSGKKGVIELACTLSRKSGITPATIELGILGGGCRIETGLAKTDAVTAARALQELGAIVDVRPARENEAETPIGIEPDAEASASELPAPPPPFAGPGHASRSGSQDSFESLDMSGSEPDPARSHGRPERAEPERVFGVRAAQQPSPAPSEARPAPRTAPAAPTPPVATRPIPARAASRSGGPKWPPADGQRAATAARVKPMVSDPAEASPDVTAANGPTFVPPTDAKLELDRESRTSGRAPETGANLEPVVVAGATIGIAGAALSSQEVPSLPASASGRNPTVVNRTADRTSGPFALTPMLVYRGLVARDRVTSALITAAIALALGLIVAHGWVRGDTAMASARLEDELRDSIADPIGVDAGRLRAPEAIAGELGSELSGHRKRFFLVWAVVAVPLIVAGALLRRTTATAPAATM